MTGPIGGRIFDIKVSPRSGSIWIATLHGLSIYETKTKKWRYLTCAHGLPEDQVNAIAFDTVENIYLATQCHGIVILKKEGDVYRVATHIQAPKGFGNNGKLPIPIVATGDGLATNLINDILVTKKGYLVVATTTGLVWSKDKGRTWRFLRGEDYFEKAKLLYQSPLKANEKAPPLNYALLPCDFLTKLIELNGQILITTRGRGLAVFDPERGVVEKNPYTFLSHHRQKLDLFNSFLVTEKHLYIGAYPGGVIQIPCKTHLEFAQKESTLKDFPEVGQKLTLQDLRTRMQI